MSRCPAPTRRFRDAPRRQPPYKKILRGRRERPRSAPVDFAALERAFAVSLRVSWCAALRVLRVLRAALRDGLCRVGWRQLRAACGDIRCYLTGLCAMSSEIAGCDFAFKRCLSLLSLERAACSWHSRASGVTRAAAATHEHYILKFVMFRDVCRVS